MAGMTLGDACIGGRQLLRGAGLLGVAAALGGGVYRGQGVANETPFTAFTRMVPVSASSHETRFSAGRAS